MVAAVKVSLFKMDQNIFILDDTNDNYSIVDTIPVPTEVLAETLYQVIEKYPITEIKFDGSKSFNQHFINKFQKIEKLNYGKNNIKITIMGE